MQFISCVSLLFCTALCFPLMIVPVMRHSDLNRITLATVVYQILSKVVH